MLKTIVLLYFWINELRESSKEQHLIEKKNYSKVFTITFDQFNASLLGINFFKKNTNPKSIMNLIFFCVFFIIILLFLYNNYF